MLEAFALGTIWFFIFTIICVISLFYFVETEKIARSILTVGFYTIFLQFVVKVDVFSSIIQNPIKSLLILLLYFFIGFVWSFVKWFMYVNKQALMIKIERTEFLKRHSDKHCLTITLDTPIPEDLLSTWRHSKSYIRKPIVHENKARISHWVIYWPISVIWSLLNDFIRKTIDIIVLKIKFVYEKITSNAFKTIEKEI